jgi:hypothetical protein
MEHGAERAALTTPRGSRSSRFKATATASEATVSPPGRASAATQTVAFAEGRELPLAEASRARRAVRPR